MIEFAFFMLIFQKLDMPVMAGVSFFLFLLCAAAKVVEYFSLKKGE